MSRSDGAEDEMGLDLAQAGPGGMLPNSCIAVWDPDSHNRDVPVVAVGVPASSSFAKISLVFGFIANAIAGQSP